MINKILLIAFIILFALQISVSLLYSNFTIQLSQKYSTLKNSIDKAEIKNQNLQEKLGQTSNINSLYNQIINKDYFPIKQELNLKQ